MLKFKKIALTAFIVMSGTSVLNTQATAAPAPLSWSFGAAALYLQPSFGGNGLGYSAYGNYSGNDDNGVYVGTNGASNPIININPNRSWGFLINGMYRFDAANDLNIEWYHLQDSKSDEFPFRSVFSGNYDGFYAGDFKLQQNWDAVNLELGHSIPFDGNKLIRVHAGLAFVNIRNHFTNYPRLVPAGNPIFVTSDTLSYIGGGPRLGSDFTYNSNYGFQVYADLAASLLLGRSKQDNSGFENYTNVTYGFQPYGTPNYNQSHNNVIVTELDAILGVKYNYYISTNNMLTFDIGYQWISYLSAINTYANVGIVGTSSGASIGTHSNANFNLSGLILGLTWSM